MRIGLHRTIMALLMLIGALVGGYFCALAWVLIRIYLPLRLESVPLEIHLLVPFLIGAYGGAHLSLCLFGALIPAKCSHCGAKAHVRAGALGLGIDYACLDGEKHPEPSIGK